MVFGELKFDPTIQFSDIGVLITILLVAWKIFRHVNRMEFQVNLMWEFFKDRILTNGEANRYEKMLRARKR